MGYYAGQTTPLVFTFEDFDPTTASKVVLSFAYGNSTLLEKDEDDLTITSSTITLNLTQAESLSFPVGTVKVQMNFIVSGERIPTDVVYLNVDKNLHMQVIS